MRPVDRDILTSLRKQCDKEHAQRLEYIRKDGEIDKQYQEAKARNRNSRINYNRNCMKHALEMIAEWEKRLTENGDFDDETARRAEYVREKIRNFAALAGSNWNGDYAATAKEAMKSFDTEYINSEVNRLTQDFYDKQPTDMRFSPGLVTASAAKEVNKRLDELRRSKKWIDVE